MENQCLIFEVSRFTRYEAMKAVQNAQNGVVRGHSRSWAMPPFDRAHTTSYLALIETISCRRGVMVSGVRRMNEVNACRARLVAGWVTVFGRVYHLGM